MNWPCLRRALPALALLAAGGSLSPAMAVDGNCAAGMNALSFKVQYVRYDCAGPAQGICKRNHTGTPPQVKHLGGRNWRVIYTCTRTPPGGSAGPKPKFYRTCGSHFKKAAAGRGGAYSCIRLIQTQCQVKFQPGGLGISHQSGKVWELKYRCMVTAG